MIGYPTKRRLILQENRGGLRGQKSGPVRPLFPGERSPTRSAGSLSPQRVVEITVHRTLPSY